MTSQMNVHVALIRKLRGSFMWHTFSGIFYMGVCTTGHWQTSGRLVLELNVCTVYPGTLSLKKPLKSTYHNALQPGRPLLTSVDDLRLLMAKLGHIWAYSNYCCPVKPTNGRELLWPGLVPKTVLKERCRKYVAKVTQ